MSITLNLRYTGKNGNAHKFAEEMISSGTVAAIRAEAGNLRYEYFRKLFFLSIVGMIRLLLMVITPLR